MTDTQPFVSTPNERAYFSIIPHIADDDLNLHEYRLYGHYVKVCGMCRGVCDQSLLEMADKLGMGKAKLIETRESLRVKGYIRYLRKGKADAEIGKGETYVVAITDKWRENVERYSETSGSIQNSYQTDSGSNENSSGSNENQKEEEVKKEEKVTPPKARAGIRPTNTEFEEQIDEAESLPVPDAKDLKLAHYIQATTGKTLTAKQIKRLGQKIKINGGGDSLMLEYASPEYMYVNEKGFSQFVMSRLEAYKAQGGFDKMDMIIGDICNYGRGGEKGQPGWLAWKAKHPEFTAPLPANAAVPLHQQRTITPSTERGTEEIRIDLSRYEPAPIKVRVK